MMFARWNSYDECVSEMMLFHDEAGARQIADSIKNRLDCGVLYKSEDIPMQVMKTAEGEIITYGPASWEKRDSVGDIVTTKFMVNFFDKWFNKVKPEYRNIMLEHRNYKIGEPLLKWQAPNGDMYYTHVHEKAPMLLAKIRSDDGLATTQKMRAEILAGNYKSYSISWFPLKYDVGVDAAGQSTKTHWDGDPVEVTICRNGMIDAAKFSVLKQSDEDVKKLSDMMGKPFAGYKDFADCVARNRDRDNPDAYCGYIMHQVEGKEEAGKAAPESQPNKSAEKPKDVPIVQSLVDETVNMIRTNIVRAVKENISANQALPRTAKAINLSAVEVGEDVKVPLELRLRLNELFKKALDNVESTKDKDTTS